MFANGRRNSNTISPSKDPDVFAQGERGSDPTKLDDCSGMTCETYSSDPHMASGDLESLLVKLTAELKTLRHEVEAIDDDNLDENDENLFSELVGDHHLPILLQEVGADTPSPSTQITDETLESQFSRGLPSGRLRRQGSGIPKPQGGLSDRDAVGAESAETLSPDVQNSTKAPSRIPKPPSDITRDKGQGEVVLGAPSKTHTTIQGRDHIDKTTAMRQGSDEVSVAPMNQEDKRLSPGVPSSDGIHQSQSDGCKGISLPAKGSQSRAEVVAAAVNHSCDDDESLSSFDSLALPGPIEGDLAELASIDPFCSVESGQAAYGGCVENSAGTMVRHHGSTMTSISSTSIFWGEEGQLCDIESESGTWLYDPLESSEDDALSKASFDVVPPTRLTPIAPCDWPSPEEQPPSKGDGRCGDPFRPDDKGETVGGGVGTGVQSAGVAAMALGCDDRYRDEVDSSNLGCQTSVSDDGDIMRFRMSSWGSSGCGSSSWRGDFPFCVDTFDGNACTEGWDGRLGMEARHSTATTSLPLVLDTFPPAVQLLDTQSADMPCFQDEEYIEIGMMDSSESSVLEWNFSSPTSKDADESTSTLNSQVVSLGLGHCHVFQHGSLGLDSVDEGIESNTGKRVDADATQEDFYRLQNELKKLHGYPPVVFDELLSPSSSDEEVLEETRFDLRDIDFGYSSGSPTESSDDFLDIGSDETSDGYTSNSEDGSTSECNDIDIDDTYSPPPSPRSVEIPSLDLSMANMIFSDPAALWNPQLPLQSAPPSESTTARESISMNSVSVRDWIASGSSFKSTTPETPTGTTLVPSMIHPWGVSLSGEAGSGIPSGCTSIGQNPLWIPMMDCDNMEAPQLDPSHDKDDVASQDSFSFGQIGSVGPRSSSSTGLDYMDPTYVSSCDESISSCTQSVEDSKTQRSGIGKDPASLPAGRMLWYPRPRMGMCKRLFHSLKRGKRSLSRGRVSQKGFSVCLPFGRKGRRQQWDWSWERPLSSL